MTFVHVITECFGEIIRTNGLTFRDYCEYPTLVRPAHNNKPTVALLKWPGSMNLIIGKLANPFGSMLTSIRVHKNRGLVDPVVVWMRVAINCDASSCAGVGPTGQLTIISRCLLKCL
jgi:hypothetical protein